MCERCFGQQTNLDRHLKKHEMDGGAGGSGGLGFRTTSSASVLSSASPEVSISSPEDFHHQHHQQPSTDHSQMMMMQQLIHPPSAAAAAAAAAASSYFADIRKFMGQVTADSLAAKYQQSTNVPQSDEELSCQLTEQPVRLQMAN